MLLFLQYLVKLKNKKFKDVSDEELVKLYVESQKNLYFEEIYERYADKVYRKCYSFVNDKAKAEDFAHDIFLKLVFKIGTFKETAKFSTWLFSITYNHCMDQLRLAKKKSEQSLDEEFDLPEEEYDYEFANMQAQGLKKTLDKIPADEKALLLMKYQDDFSIKEISDTFKISESAVKMRLMRTKEKVKKLYLEHITVLSLVIIKILLFLKK